MDFPINPSELPWWGWLLCTIVLALISLFSFEGARNNKDWVGSGCLAIGFLTALFAIIVGIIAVARLVKWAWGS